ncbi:shootin-1 isoform X2 [Carcharodon carcharias]|uniref:shootin-1 isoform X2 n=1 Tax=Carcharodon carcharias TaxID=13397 RepID=UPI001B7E0120|nr:shootin-1 isoform X2 [Carcharodon carcharias]
MRSMGQPFDFLLTVQIRDRAKMATSEEDKHIKNLKDLSKQAIVEYEELVKENEKIREENARLIEEKNNVIQQVKEFHRVSQMMIEEVSTMQDHLEIEKSCRESAEAFASKLNKDNKSLKRISMLYMAKLGTETIPVELPLEEDSAINVTNATLDKDARCSSVECQQQIQELRDNLTTTSEEKKQLSFHLENLRDQWKDLTDKLQKEEQRNIDLAAEVDKQSQILAKYNKVSVMALEEYEDLEKSLDLEKDLRKEAESFAHEMLVEQKKLKRQSQILIQKMVPNEQLMKALDELAIVTETIEEERILHERKLKEMEEQLEDSTLKKEINSLMKQLEFLKEDKEELELKCQNYYQQVKDLKHTIDKLQKQIQQAENSIPLPPPPPPLPVPSPSSSPLKNLMMIICKRQKASNLSGFEKAHSKESGQPLEDLKKQAVDEMMDRIKKGVRLRKIDHTDRTLLIRSKPPEENALQELRGMLKSSKVGTLTTITQVTEENELERVLRHRKTAAETNASGKFSVISACDP